MERYSIGVTGQIQRGFEPAAVQQRLATLFKCPPEKALRLISGKPVTLKTGLDRQTTERYRQQLLKVGVELEIKMMQGTEANANPAAPSRPSTTASGNGRSPAAPSPVAVKTIPLQTAPTGHPSRSAGAPDSGSAMECPKCGTTQPHADICIKCGIVITKFRRTLIDEAEAKQSVAAPPSELEELGDFVGHNFSAYRHKFQELLDNQGKYLFHWHWPAFFIALPWLLYRKMYIHAIVLVALALIPVPFLGLALPILFGALGDYLYFRHCRSKLAAVDAMGAARPSAIASAGGILSIPATILCTILVSALVSYAGYHLYYKDRLNQFSSRDQLAAVSQVDGEAGKNTLGKMMAIGQFLKIYMAAEKMTGKQVPPPMSMGDIQRMFRLDAKAVSDEWGTELRYLQKDGGTWMLLSAGPDGAFETPDDISYEIPI